MFVCPPNTDSNTSPATALHSLLLAVFSESPRSLPLRPGRCLYHFGYKAQPVSRSGSSREAIGSIHDEQGLLVTFEVISDPRLAVPHLVKAHSANAIVDRDNDPEWI